MLMKQEPHSVHQKTLEHLSVVDWFQTGEWLFTSLGLNETH